MYLVLLETSGNQNFIFSTNKLRENVGASELTYRVGTTWLIDAVNQIAPTQSQTRLGSPVSAPQLRSVLLSADRNPVIESGAAVEIVVAASGKAILLVQAAETAKQIIQQITKTALKKAPGLEVCGVFQEFDWQHDRLSDVIRSLYRQFEQVRAQKPTAAMRFLRLPIVAQCATSGLPASVWDTPREEQPAARSQVSLFKRNISRDRLKSLAPLGYDFAENLGEIEADWLAVIHADGNGLGEIFLRFHDHIQANSASDNRRYINTLREFSIALDLCTENAFARAIEPFLQSGNEIPKSGNGIPIVPLILGGDDLTVVCDGRTALQFTKRFLQAFEQETARTDLPDVGDVIPRIAAVALRTDRLSSCAGVAIIKPHFPFAVAYDLAEQLLKSAKKVKQKLTLPDDQLKPFPCSAIDFHILYDSSGADLTQIRNKLTFKQDTATFYRHNRPYIVTPADSLSAADGFAWSDHHRWEILERQVAAVQAPDPNNDGRRKLPNSQLHDLRSGLFLGRDVADARFRLIRDRYLSSDGSPDIREFEGEAGSLFRPEPADATDATPVYTTGLLDAIDVADFLSHSRTYS